MLLYLLLGVVTFLTQRRKRRKGTQEHIWNRLRACCCTYCLERLHFYRKDAIGARERKRLPGADYGDAVVPIAWSGYIFIARAQRALRFARDCLLQITGMLLYLLLGAVTFLSQGRKRRKGTQEHIWDRLRVCRCTY